LANIINGTDTGSGGLITTGDSSDELQLQTAEVARVTLTNSAVVVNESGADVDFRVEGDTDSNLLFVDASADAVGIGTSSPASKLHIQANANAISVDDGLSVRNSNSGSSAGARIALGNDVGTAPGLQLASSTNTTFGANALTVYQNLSAPVTFWTNNTERMRITSSGQFLVGKTAAGTATTGAEMLPGGQVIATAVSDDCFIANRKTTDGTIIGLRKDNTAVGSIGTTGGELYIDFGGSTGGAVTSRTLDDYEEGTFTPAFSSSGAVFTYSVQQGAYTKIGRQVCFNIYLQLDGAQTLTANFVIITGLPFTSATISGLNVAMVCGIRLVNLTAGASILVGRLGSNSSSISLVEEGDNYATTSLNSNQLSNLSGQVMISGTYPAT
jgi:hypothetical protein